VCGPCMQLILAQCVVAGNLETAAGGNGSKVQFAVTTIGSTTCQAKDSMGHGACRRVSLSARIVVNFFVVILLSGCKRGQVWHNYKHTCVGTETRDSTSA